MKLIHRSMLLLKLLELVILEFIKIIIINYLFINYSRARVVLGGGGKFGGGKCQGFHSFLHTLNPNSNNFPRSTIPATPYSFLFFRDGEDQSHNRYRSSKSSTIHER